MKRVGSPALKILPMLKGGCIFAVTLLSLFSSSCTNIGNSKNKKSTTSFFTQSDVNAGAGGEFYLIQVVPDSVSPGSVYAMIGQNQEFDTYCGGTYGTCQCEYTYQQPGVGLQTTAVNNTYRESDMIRCPNSVPTGINSFDVRIVTTGTTVHASNSITVTLSGNGSFASSTNYIDLSSELSFVGVDRFQCRKREFIANPLDPGVIDPLQSGDPSILYPFNYYTTNVSSSIINFQSFSNQSNGVISGWDCSLTRTHDNSLHEWANPMVFSAVQCTSDFCLGDSELIYPSNSLASGKIPVLNPSATGKRRSSFSLAKQAYGVFQSPVRAAVAPNGYTGSTFGVLGYGAKPIPNSLGSSSCPSVSIPSNARWVKLWNYRATDITPPKKVTTSVDTNRAAIACNQRTEPAEFPSCANLAASGDGSASPADFSGAIYSLDSVSGTSGVHALRLGLLLSGAGSSNASACYNILAGGFWEPSRFKFDSSISLETMRNSPWGVYSAATTTAAIGTLSSLFGAAGTYEYYSGAGAPAHTIPFDTQITTAPVSGSTDNYTDQIFVVTDPSVNDNAMRNQSSSVDEYHPVTYRTKAECTGPSRATCTTGELHWDINVKEVDQPTGPDFYPLCVLQFTD